MPCPQRTRPHCGRDADVEQGDPSAGPHDPAELVEEPAEVDEVAQCEPARHTVDRSVGHGEPEDVGLDRGAPLRSAMSIPRSRSTAQRPVPGLGQVEAEVTGPAGQVEDAAAGGYRASERTARRRQRTSRRNVMIRFTRSRPCPTATARSRARTRTPSAACSGRCAARPRPAGPTSSTAVTVADAHDGDDLVAPPLARATGDHAVVHAGMALDRRLDLLGEDLLAAGVDRHRVAPVQLDHPVGAQPRPVAGHGVAHAVDHGIRACGLVGIAQVAERQTAALGQPAELVRRRARARGRGRPTARGCPGMIGNVPVVAPAPADTCDSCPPASLEPSPSTIISVGRWARNSSFRCADSGAPPDSSTVRLDRSYEPRSSSSSNGRANASPTMSRKFSARARSGPTRRPGRGARAPTARTPCRRRSTCGSSSSGRRRA